MGEVILDIKKEEVSLDIKSSVAVQGGGGGGGTGTVTSVGLTMPTGFSVSNSPVTSNGTLRVTFANGYSLPTNNKQGQWDEAYGYAHREYFDADEPGKETLSGECYITGLMPGRVYSLSAATSLTIEGYDYDSSKFDCICFPETYIIIDTEEGLNDGISFEPRMTVYWVEGSITDFSEAGKYLIKVKGNIWEAKKIS